MALRVAIVGAGVVGLATTAELIRTGADVRCYEKAEVAGAQSQGMTRIFRYAHGDSRLVTLAMQARDLWRQWEERAGRRLIGDEGLILSGAEISSAWGQAMREAGASVVPLDAAECARRLPISRMPDAPASLDPHGGATRARRTTGFLRGEVRDQLQAAEVVRIEPTGKGAVLHTPEGTWECDEVVITAGVDTVHLAEPLGLDITTEPCLHSRFTYEIREEFRNRPLSCWIDDTGLTGQGWHSYAQPVGTTGRYAVGVSWEGQPQSLDVGADEVSRQSQEVANAYVREVLPGVIPQPVDEIRCTFPRYPFLQGEDGFMAVRRDHVTAFYGNNLFKFAPLLGAALRDTATSGTLPSSLTMLAPREAESAR